MGQPHIVPLMEEALAVLERARALTGGEGLIFPGSAAGSRCRTRHSRSV